MAAAFKFAFSIGNWDPSAVTHTVVTENSGASTVAVGDLIVVGVPYQIVSDTGITVTDSLGNSYTEDANSHFIDADGPCFRAFYCISAFAGADTITATAASAVSRFGIAAACYSGVSGFQVSAANNRQVGVGTGTDAMTSASATVTAAPALVVGFGNDVVGANGANINAGTGFAKRVTLQKANTQADFVNLEDARVLATGAKAATFTVLVTGDDVNTGVLVFTESVAVAAGPLPRSLYVMP